MKNNKNFPARIQHLSLNLLLIISVFAFFSFIPAKQSGTYNNPVISGFNPDPSICRVGEDYYLVTSTFEYFPGVPVYHSKDLVHWKMISHVLQRPSQLNLDSTKSTSGIYAPTIRYNKGTFYMITTLVGAKKGQPGGNFVVTAKKPEGPWSEPHWIAGSPGIDPSLFFDEDGKVYYCGNIAPPPAKKVWGKHFDIYVQEIDPKEWKFKGDRTIALNGAEYYGKGTLDGGIETGVNDYESPHIYKKDGFYYLMIAHGGTRHNHAVSIWRSKNIFGPYDMNPANPILTHRAFPLDHPFTSTGHADLIQTQKGEWWIFYLAKRPYGGDNHILGRETFMSPVEWPVGGWPVVNPRGSVGHGELVHPLPNLKEQKNNQVNSMDPFDDKTLQPQWTFIRTPRSQWWSLTERKGYLRMRLRPEMISELVNPSFVGKRQESPNCSATVKMDFSPASANEEAGLVVERDKNYLFRFILGMENNQPILKLIQRNGMDVAEKIIAKAPMKAKTSYLKITSSGVLYNFSYSENGKDWKILKDKVDGHMLGIEQAGPFTGTFIGMYASSNGMKSTNQADFDWFEYLDLNDLK
ncbi:MAG: glycoside hydrolase family 43 protein [Bacteroidales bacterium]|nr:glycoside hydrolase family 43 protein [Bacteroidales bacterium]